MVGELTSLLGFHIKHTEENIFLSQSKYAKNIVKKFGLKYDKSNRTLVATPVKISKDENGEPVDTIINRSMISSLLYLTTSRTDIALSIGVCVRYHANPKGSHPSFVKRIIKYIHGTSDYGILYSQYTNSSLVGLCDADWEETLMIEKLLKLDDCLLGIILYFDSARKRTVSPSLLQKLSTLQDETVALIWSG